MNYFKLSFLFLFLISFVACTDEQVDMNPDYVVVDSIDYNAQDKTYLYVSEKEELLEVTDLDALTRVFKSKYADNENLEAMLARIEAFKSELAYSQTLDLDDPKVENEYTAYLEEKYPNDSRAALGFLTNGPTSNIGWTGVTPRNLPPGNRNIADFWHPRQIGVSVFCDRTWFRGPRVLIGGVPFVTQNLANFGFNDRIDSYF